VELSLHRFWKQRLKIENGEVGEWLKPPVC
jgi:hypothetical protein